MIDYHVSEERSLAEQLDETPVGAALSELLASVDRSQLDCGGLLKLADARQRQVAHDEAQLLADLHAVARAFPDDDEAAGREGRYTWAETEAAMALRWTQGRASARMALADEVIDRLPQLHSALADGRLDVPKVLVFTTLLGPAVDTDRARALVDKVIEKAAQWTTAQLRSRLRRLLIAADPVAARKKAERKVKDRRVISWLDDGSHLAHLSGQALAPHRVAAIMERLDAVAKAARAAGDERSPDQIRADVFLDLLAGEGIAAGGPITDGAWGLTDPVDQISSDPLTRADAAAADATWAILPYEPPPDTDSDPAGEQEAPEPGAPVDPEGMSLAPVSSLWPLPPDDGTDPTHPEAETPAVRKRWLDRFDQLPTQRPATWCVLCGHVTGTATSPGPMPGPRRGVVELIATADTLIGIADLPAEISGMGAVTADIARQVAAQMHDAQWRYSVYDPMRHLVHHGVTHQRPPEPVDEALRDPRRFPTGAQATWVRARDRTCVAPACQRPARRCDVDHSLDWAKGGKTIHCNLNLLCRMHHLFKHATGSELIQLVPGIFHWKTPAGLQYRTASEPPLILDANQLAGTPKPPNPDTHLIDADHTVEEWLQPSALGADPRALSIHDLLRPEDIDEPDGLPVPVEGLHRSRRTGDLVASAAVS